jgi:NAD+ synthase (glutamine-hydrolysing)
MNCPVDFIYCNNEGCQNNGKNIVYFDGNSGVYSGKKFMPIYPEVPKTLPEQQIDAITCGFKYIINLTKTKNLIYGISGGIDSALSVALARKAIERYNLDVQITGVNMPSEYNGEKSKKFAAEVAEHFCDEYLIIPISEITQSVREKIPFESETLTHENLQARIRGSIVLMTVASIKNGIVINNGNKLETALGYATLYGDMCGAFAPLGDLTKAEVFEIARHLDIPQGLIPNENFEFDETGLAPTAELKSGQFDPMKFGYHDALLFKMRSYQGYTKEEIIRDYNNGTLRDKLGVSTYLWEKYKLFDENIFLKDLDWFVQAEKRAVFKRIQSPPIMMLSRNSYGYDYREAQ